MHIKHVIGGVHLHVRTCARADVPLFRISETAGWIALKFSVLLETHYLGVLQKSMMGTSARAHVRTCRCVPFHISETAGRIALKFSLWLETHELCVLQK